MRAFQLPRHRHRCPCQGRFADAEAGPSSGPGQGRRLLAQLPRSCDRARHLPDADKPNVIPLSDGAGEVVEVGAGVTRVKAGDRVAGCFFQRWPGGAPAADTHASALGGGVDGMLAEYVVLEEDGVVKLPAHLSFEEGATLPCAAVTAWNALVEHARIVAGDTVLVQGTGGVSIFALQFAQLHGRAGDRHLVERREARARQGSSAPRTASTTRPRPTGTRPPSNSRGGAASTTWSRSAAPARSRNRSARPPRRQGLA